MQILKRLILLSLTVLPFSLMSCNSGSSSSTPTIQYQTLNYTGSLPAGGSTGLTGIRGVRGSSDVYITGSYYAESMNNGTLYKGPISGGGTYYVYNYPSSLESTTSGVNVYSAENGEGGNVLLVGTYTVSQLGGFHNFGFLYNGPVTESQSADDWQTLVIPDSLANNESVNNTIPHSIMGNLVVGNYETPSTAGNAFIYNIVTESYIAFSYPGNDVRYTSAYGVWFNGGESYTIVGGYSHESDGSISYGFIVDYNESTNAFDNWESYTYNNEPAAITHFEGITSDGAGGYNLAGSGLESASEASFVHVGRTSSGGFGAAVWTNVSYPGSSTTTSDTVYQNYLLGVYEMPNVSGLNGYVATIP